MIIIHLKKKIKHIRQYSYNKIIDSIDFNEIECTDCHHSEWSFHARYERYTDLFSRKHKIFITRVMCSFCHKTHAIIIEDMIPYSIADFELIINIIDNKDYTFSSHVSFIKKKFSDISSVSYDSFCKICSRQNVCVFYHFST